MTRRMSRRAALGTIAGTLAALRVPAILAAEEKLRVGKAVVENFGFLPLDLGMEAGIFQRNGLAIEELTFAGGAKIAQAMAADAVDISLERRPRHGLRRQGRARDRGRLDLGIGGLHGFLVGPQSTAKRWTISRANSSASPARAR